MKNAKVTFFPLGNADTLRIDLSDDRKVFIDYANMRTGEIGDKRSDLPTLLRKDLEDAKRNFFDVVCITHIDTDHCKGFGDFFWLDQAVKYQGGDRVKINELWVPAAAILEEGVTDDSRLVRQEARHRLRQGSGVRVFSLPKRLKAWMKREGINYEERKHLIVDAGKLVPDFSSDGPEGVEFFVHSPFGWRQDENTVIERNEDSVVLHATFKIDGQESRFLIASDVKHDTLSDIVNITRERKNDDRLRWDLLKLPHHCSYLSIGPDIGTEMTEPVPETKWLYETQREEGSYIVSPSKPIPVSGSREDKDVQPPHRQAANYHKAVSSEKDGRFIVTMEQPSSTNPRPFSLTISERGISMTVAASLLSSGAGGSPPRAG